MEDVMLWGYKAAVNWGQRRAGCTGHPGMVSIGFLGQDSKAGLLEGMLGCLKLCPLLVRQVLSKGNNKINPEPAMDEPSQPGSPWHRGTGILGFASSCSWLSSCAGRFGGTTSSQCRMMSRAPWDIFPLCNPTKPPQVNYTWLLSWFEAIPVQSPPVIARNPQRGNN